MPANNYQEVIEAWVNRKPARSGNLATDGRHLTSYGVVIGYHSIETPDTPVLIMFPVASRTTAKHLKIASRYPSTRLITPSSSSLEEMEDSLAENASTVNVRW